MKKTFKYILSLAFIFSSFLLMESVNAVNDSKICIYQVDRKIRNNNLHVIVRDDGSAYIAKTYGHPQGSLLNWNKADIGGFSGKKYFLENNYACPPYMVINVQNFGSNDVYASDKGSLSKIDGEILGEVNCPLVGEGLANSASDEIKNKAKYTFKTPKNCVCETNPSIEPNAEKSFSASFTINSTLEAPKVSVSYYATNNIALANWYLSDDLNFGNYSHVSNLINKDSCPEYVIYSHTAWAIYASDSANLSNIKDKGLIKAACHEEAKPTPKSNSNSTSSKTSNSTSTNTSNNVSNSHNADFMTIDQYKQCGGSAGALITNIPSIVPRITSTLYNTIMVLVPVILIIMGTIDLVKGIMSQKEDEIKKGREAFIKRIIGSVIIFLIVLIVKFFVGVVARDGGNRARIVDCIDCFVSNSCDIMK